MRGADIGPDDRPTRGRNVGAGLARQRAAAFVVPLEEQQAGERLDIVATARDTAAHGVAVAPKFLDECCRVHSRGLIRSYVFTSGENEPLGGKFSRRRRLAIPNGIRTDGTA